MAIFSAIRYGFRVLGKGPFSSLKYIHAFKERKIEYAFDFTILLAKGEPSG